MAKDYEIEIEVAIAKIRDALLNYRAFVQAIADKVRQVHLATNRTVPGINGGNPRNPNSSNVNGS